MSQPAARKAGLFQSLKNIGATLLAMVQTRLELLGNELEIQKRALLKLLVLALAAVISAGLAAVSLLGLVTLLLWEQRVVVLAVFVALFIGAAGACAWAALRVLRDAEPPFSGTLDELREDLHRLRAATHHDGPAPR